MFRMQIIRSVFVGILCLAAWGWGATHLVPQDYEKIQDALDICGPGDTVLVAPGVYFERLLMPGVDITLSGIDPYDPCAVAATIIDGGGAGATITFTGAESPLCVVQGLTITGGQNAGGGGGGVAGHGTQATLSRCVITDNTAQFGGGIHNWGGRIEWCRIADNEAGARGGGLYSENLSPYVTHCVFEGNRAWRGGAALIRGANDAVFANTLMTGNHGFHYGSAIFIDDDGSPAQSRCRIVNCTIAFNIDSASNHMGDVDCRDAHAEIIGSIIWSDNVSLGINDPCRVTYSCVRYAALYSSGSYQKWTDLTLWGENIQESPRFANTDEGDFRLLEHSPCRDAGDPGYAGVGEVDLKGHQRVHNGRIDMGAYEILPSLRIERPVGDEVWTGGSSHVLTWSGTFAGNVDVAYSLDGGLNWITEALDTANAGYYQWTLPLADADDCRVRVRAHDEPADIIYEDSAAFAIVPYQYQAAVPTVWPMLGRNAAHTGHTESLGPEVGCVAWRFDAGEPFFAPPTLGHDGRVHAVCENGAIYTFDPCGVLLWQYDLATTPLTAPVVGHDGGLYIGDADGWLHALDVDGQLRWRFRTEGMIYGCPSVDEDGNVYFGSQDGKLYALAADGSERWSFSTRGPSDLIPGSIMTSPTIGLDGSIYVGGLYDPCLYALDPDDGSVLWSRDLGENAWIFTAPVITNNGIVCIAPLHQQTLYGLEPATGAVVFSRDLVDLGGSANLPLAGLVAYWPFDTVSNGFTPEVIGGHTGALGNNVSLWPDGGYLGGALEFGGVGSFVMAQDHYDGITGDEARTVTAWIKTETAGEIIGWGSSDPGRKWVMRVQGDEVGAAGALRLEVSYGYVIGSTDLRDGQWRHVAAVMDAGAAVEDIRLYVNGFPETLSAVLPHHVDTAGGNAVMIGEYHSSGRNFQGLIDEVRIYDRALSYAELRAGTPEPLPDIGQSVWSEPVLGPDGGIYVSMDDPYLRAFDAQGNLRWVQRLGWVGGFTLSTGGDGLIYAASDDQSLYVVSPEGAVLAVFDGDGWLAYPVIGDNGDVYVADAAGTLWALTAECPVGRRDLRRLTDIDEDSMTNLQDFALLSGQWLVCNEMDSGGNPVAGCISLADAFYLLGDVNRDGRVDWLDVALLASQWLETD